MKKLLLLALAGLALSSCNKPDSENNGAPAALSAGFGQNFSLSYRQQALVPATSRPELTIAATDFQYAFCPQGSLCFAPDFVWPTLSVTDERGHEQVLQLPTNRVSSATLLDSTSIRANGARYLLYYTKWNISSSKKHPEKQDLSVTLRVVKPK